MDDKGCIIVFSSIKWKVVDKETRKVIARGYRNPEKLFVLEKKNPVINKRYSSYSLIKSKRIWSLLALLEKGPQIDPYRL